MSKDSGSGARLAFAPYAFVGVARGDTVASHVPGQMYSAYADDYSVGGDFIGSSFLYPSAHGAAYANEDVDYDGADQVPRAAYTGVTGAAYSSYEYDYVCGVFEGWRFLFTTVPTGAKYSSPGRPARRWSAGATTR